MSAIEQFRDSDTLQCSGIDYTVSIPFSGTYRSTARPFCKEKAGGDLDFTLTSSDLNLIIPDLSFRLNATDINEDASTVTWAVDQGLDVWFSGAHLTHVSGKILGRIEETLETLGPGCTGDTRLFRTILRTAGTDSFLRVSTSLGDAGATDIVTGISSGEEVGSIHFNVSIRAKDWVSTDCGSQYQRVGSTVTFIADLQAVSVFGMTDVLRYSWSLPPGVTALGPTDERTVTIKIDEPGTFEIAVSVLVATDVHSGERTRKLSFVALTEEGEDFHRKLCFFTHRTAFIWRVLQHGFAGRESNTIPYFVDPLWDPVPFNRVSGNSPAVRNLMKQELYDLAREFGNISDEAQKIAGLAKMLASTK